MDGEEGYLLCQNDVCKLKSLGLGVPSQGHIVTHAINAHALNGNGLSGARDGSLTQVHHGIGREKALMETNHRKINRSGFGQAIFIKGCDHNLVIAWR